MVTKTLQNWVVVVRRGDSGGLRSFSFFADAVNFMQEMCNIGCTCTVKGGVDNRVMMEYSLTVGGHTDVRETIEKGGA